MGQVVVVVREYMYTGHQMCKSIIIYLVTKIMVFGFHRPQAILRIFKYVTIFSMI